MMQNRVKPLESEGVDAECTEGWPLISGGAFVTVGKRGMRC